MQHVEGVLDLWGKSIPQLKWEITVSSSKCCNECSFKRLDCAFGSVDGVIVWLHDLEFAFVLGEKFFDMLCGLIIHNVQLWLKPFCCHFFKVSFVCSEDAHVVQPGDELHKDGIGFIMVEYEKTNTAIKGHEREQSCEVVVEDAAISV